MSWNYRVVLHDVHETTTGLRSDLDKTNQFYQIHEVYYTKSGEITAWSKTGDEPFVGMEDGKPKRQFLLLFSRYKKALKKPILKLSELLNIHSVSKA